LIDTPSLVEALRNGQVGGYGTDVLMQEPISEQEPLRGLSNVLITPHVGSRTVESVERQGLLALQNVLQGIRNAGDPSSWPQGAVCVLPKSAKRTDSDAAS
jgi:D-3-phosphoglycerate dehydrogenase